MTAIEVLRAMLDERGVEYDYTDRLSEVPSYQSVIWWFNTADKAELREYHDSSTQLVINSSKTHITPAQAIAATLGPGTLTAEQVSNATYAHSIHADCADADWQAVADELNGMLNDADATPTRQDGANERDQLKAENAKLLEIGDRLFDKTLELGTENTNLRTQLADVTESMGRVEERCAKLRELASRAYRIAKTLCDAWEGPCDEIESGSSWRAVCPARERDEECVHGLIEHDLRELGIEVSE